MSMVTAVTEARETASGSNIPARRIAFLSRSSMSSTAGSSEKKNEYFCMWRILLKLSQNGLSFNVAGTKKKSCIGLKTCSFTFLVIIFGAPDLAKLHGRKHSFPWSVVGKTMAQEGSGYHETGARFSKQAPLRGHFQSLGPTPPEWLTLMERQPNTGRSIIATGGMTWKSSQANAWVCHTGLRSIKATRTHKKKVSSYPTFVLSGSHFPATTKTCDVTGDSPQMSSLNN